MEIYFEHVLTERTCQKWFARFKSADFGLEMLLEDYQKDDQSAESTAKPNIHEAKVMLCITWDQKGVLYYELLKPGETIYGESYWLINKLKLTNAEKRSEFTTRRKTS